MSAAGEPGRARTVRGVGALVVIAVVVIAIVAWRIADDGGAAERTETTVAPASPASTSTSVDIGVDLPAGRAPVPVESQLPWPAPPSDHEPHLITSRGDGPLVAMSDGLAILYVNSIGRLTLLDLATGDRTEVEVSPARHRDAIALEPGGFRSLVRRMNVDLAGPGATVLHLHRTSLLTGWSVEPEPGLHLCLTVSCVAGGRIERLVEADASRSSGVGLEPLDGAGRPDIVDLVELDAPVDGRFRIVTAASGSVRLPEPIGGSVWLVTGMARSAPTP